MPRALERISNEDSRDHSRLMSLGIRWALNSHEAPNYTPCTSHAFAAPGSHDRSLCDVEVVFKVGVEREKPGMVKIILTNPLGGRPMCHLSGSSVRLGFPSALEQIAFLWVKHQMRLLA